MSVVVRDLQPGDVVFVDGELPLGRLIHAVRERRSVPQGGAVWFTPVEVETGTAVGKKRYVYLTGMQKWADDGGAKVLRPARMSSPS